MRQVPAAVSEPLVVVGATENVLTTLLASKFSPVFGPAEKAVNAAGD